jgi:hypothetical protein
MTCSTSAIVSPRAPVFASSDGPTGVSNVSSFGARMPA